MSPEAQAFSVADLFPDRAAVKRAVDLLIPMARRAAEQTDTLVDDAAVDMLEALHKSELAQEWVASEVSRQDRIPEGALAVSAMPDEVKQDLVHHLPEPRREEFLQGAILEKALSWGLPLLLQILRQVIFRK